MSSSSQTLEKPPPSTISLVIATALLAGTIGYFVGSGSSLGLFSSSTSSSYPRRKTRWPGKPLPNGPKKSWPNNYDVNVHVDSSDEELMEQRRRRNADADGGSGGESDEESLESFGDGDGILRNEFEGHERDEVKLVLCVRTDLGMGKGKIAAQASHATLSVYKHILSTNPSSQVLKRWERGGQAKVALQVKSEDEMLTLQAMALSLGLAARVIQDAGRTQIASGTRTVLGILGPKGVVDQVTGHLKLL